MRSFSLSLFLLTLLPYVFIPVSDSYSNSDSGPLRSIMIVLDVCGYGPSILNFSTISSSVKAAFAECSYGIASLEMSEHPITITVPCGSKKTCAYEEWSRIADDAVGLKAEDRRHRIYILSKGVCDFAGLANVDCVNRGQVCRVWISGDVVTESMVYVHELGHNIGLTHARYMSDDYGDNSDAMGYCCRMRCFNAPHLEQLGWSAPLYVLQPKTASYSTYLALPHSQLKKNHFAILKSQSPLPWYYLQYRRLIGMETVDTGMSESVNVYAVRQGNSIMSITTLVDVLKQSSHVRWRRDGWYVNLIKQNKTHAVVRVYWEANWK
jgi:hypothetical protein